MRFGKLRPGGSHSDRCRTRLLDAIGDTDEGAKRLFEHELRSAAADVAREEYVEGQREGQRLREETPHVQDSQAKTRQGRQR